jgi:hypothetical protein
VVPLIPKSWHQLRHSSLADSGHGVKFLNLIRPLRFV